MAALLRARLPQKSEVLMPKGKLIPAASRFRVVDSSKIAGLVFGVSGRKESPYAAALIDLNRQTDDNAVLEVESLGAKQSFIAQARKLNLSILFGELGGKLYVKIVGAKTPEGIILEALAKKPMDKTELVAAVGKMFPKLNAGDIQTKISVLSQSGQINLTDRSDGPGRTMRKVWVLTGKSAAA